MHGNFYWAPAKFERRPVQLGQDGGFSSVSKGITGALGLPMVTDGLVLMGLGAATGLVGVYWAKKKTKVVGKKLSPFWNFVFGTGGIGTALAILGAVPLVALGAFEVGGGVLIKNKLRELDQAALQYAQPK